MGRNLEQLIADEKSDVVASAQAMAADILLNIHLAELREKVQKRRLKWRRRWASDSPPSRSWKSGRDLKLSSLKRYVEAAGGKLTLDVELPDGSHYEFVL